MGIIIGFLLCLAVAILAPVLISRATARRVHDDAGGVVMEVPGSVKLTNWAVRGVFGLIAVFLIIGTSFITVGDNEIALMKRIM